MGNVNKSYCTRGLSLKLKLMTLLLLFLLMLLSFKGNAQDDGLVENTFRGNQLINTQTTNTLPKGSFEFSIKHRFGLINFDNSMVKQFLGLDMPGNIRIGLAMPITDRAYIGIGRTKSGKKIDIEGKYLLVRQREDNSTPITIAIYENIALMTDEFHNGHHGNQNVFFADSITPFKNKFTHRFSYNTQVIISRKFSEKISLQVSPGVIYRNISQPGLDNLLWVTSIGGSIKTGLRSSIIFEYPFVFNNRKNAALYPLSFGYEFGTVGHIFQLFVTTSNEILEQDIYSYISPEDIRKNFAIGFNIKRLFWTK